MSYTAAIFDLDGTLLNTLGDLQGAVNFALEKRGYPSRSTEEVRERVGNGIRRLLTLSLPERTSDAEIDACLADFRQYYEAHLMDKTLPYDGIPSLVSTLSQQGVRLAVLSNKYDPAAKRLTQHFFGNDIQLTLGERPGVPRKPDPAGALDALRSLKADPAHTLYIGDSAVDIQTAHNAGIPSVGVTWGFRSRAVLEEANAAHIVDHPAEILPLFSAP